MQEIIGNFRIIEKLGEGGMGEVYKGLDTVLEREVAIKVLRPELSSQPDILERFRTEAIALARLNDPNIAMLYAFHQDPQQAYMVMEFVPGETLGDLLKRERRVPWQRALKLICQVLSGLEHAHGKNIVHRDIKPANIMLTPEGSPKLMDFGIARILQRSRLTKTGFLIGTLQYMSPEQVQGLEADGRSDLYSLGIVLYELLTGRIPFDKSTDYEIIRAQVEQPPKPPSEFLPDLDPEIENAILKALAKNPSDRFETAAAFRQTLLKISNRGNESAAPHDRKITPKTRVAPKNPTLDSPEPESSPFFPTPGRMIGTLLVLIGIGFGGWLFLKGEPSKVEETAILERSASTEEEGKKESESVSKFVPPQREDKVDESAISDEASSSPAKIPRNTEERDQERDSDKGIAGNKRRPSLVDPTQLPDIDPATIGIPSTVEIVEEKPIVTSKATQKTRSQQSAVSKKTIQTPKAPVTKKNKDWSTLDFGETYQ